MECICNLNKHACSLYKIRELKKEPFYPRSNNDVPQKLVQSYIETLQHRSQYPLPATHPTLPKPTKPFISSYSVIAIVLFCSVPGKACLAVCSVTLVAYWPAIVLTSVMKGI